MKAITIYQPWASLIWLVGHPNPMIAALGKHNETRGWDTRYRGPLAIHASKDRRFLHLINQEPFKGVFKKAGISLFDLPFGAVVAVCELEDIYFITIGKLVKQRKFGKPLLLPLPAEPEISFGDYTPQRYAWMLRKVRQLPEPIPVRGMQGLWNWEVPEGVKL